MRSSSVILCMLVVLGASSSCTAPAQPAAEEHSHALSKPDARQDTTLLLRFAPPAGFSRSHIEEGSFASFLRHLPLKPPETSVRLYNGSLKSRQDVHAAVIDISVGDKDLQQCADAIMRLRAEYLFATGRSDEIAFDFTNGFRADWKRWRTGDRIEVRGNACRWVPGGIADASHDQLMRYLSMVFTYAGTRSLERELSRSTGARIAELHAGDVFVQGGSPGHAVIVVDTAQDSTGRIAFLLAQSYMPAQDIHVLRDPEHPGSGPWFLFEDKEALRTPEWTFDWTDRRQWP